MANYIRFDWAMKRLLRNKANHAVLEGLMYSLLNEKFTSSVFWKARQTNSLRTISSTAWTFLPKTRRES